jgi:hypothetical protein
MEYALSPEVHSELLGHLLQLQFGELEGTDDDLEVARGQHSRDLTGYGLDAKYLKQELLRGVVDHAQKSLNATVANAGSGRGGVDL